MLKIKKLTPSAANRKMISIEKFCDKHNLNFERSGGMGSYETCYISNYYQEDCDLITVRISDHPTGHTAGLDRMIDFSATPLAELKYELCKVFGIYLA